MGNRAILFLCGALLCGACLSPEERAKRAEAEAKELAQKADDAVTHLTQVGAVLPDAKHLKAQACPSEMAGHTIGYSPVDAAYFGQFKPTGFTPIPKKALPTYRKFTAQGDDYHGFWYRADPFDRIQAALKDDPRDDHNVAYGYSDLIWKGSRNGVPEGHFAVVYPTREKLPGIDNYPGKGDVVLDSAEFDGWVVLVDPQKGAVLCQAPFQAGNSESLTFRVGEDPLGVAFDDYEDQFARAIETALDKQGADLRHYSAW